MVAIIDYGVGNLGSILNMLKRIGSDSIITSDPTIIEQATHLILPGVGHYDYGMNQLNKANLVDILNKQVLEFKKPILGICLGVQLFTKRSDEGRENGLAWINGQTVEFNRIKLGNYQKIPHMGWSDIQIKKSSKLFEGMFDNPRFYFVHSFHLECEDPNDILVSANYGYEFVAGVEKDNIIGVQFHPEKSHKFGMKVFQNFINNY